MSLNWNSIRSLENSQNDGFEELVCQLARKETVPNGVNFIRKGKPDAGVECFWILENGDEWAWQAKFFTTSPSANQWSQIDDSVRTVLEKHSSLKKYFVAIPTDPSDARLDGQTSMLDKWNDRVTKWQNWASENGLTVEFIPWCSSDLIERLQKSENAGLTYFWFNKEEFTDAWCREQTESAIADLGKRYTPELNVELNISEVLSGIDRDEVFESRIKNLFDVLLIKGYKAIPKIEDLKIEAENLNRSLSKIQELFHNTNFQGVETIPIENFVQLLDLGSDIASRIINFYLSEERKLQEASDDGHNPKKYRGCLKNIPTCA